MQSIALALGSYLRSLRNVEPVRILALHLPQKGRLYRTEHWARFRTICMFESSNCLLAHVMTRISPYQRLSHQLSMRNTSLYAT
jgi:hypothetical protein